MITNISLITVFCLDQSQARDFYVEKLGFERAQHAKDVGEARRHLVRVRVGCVRE